jgi:transposase
MDRGFYSYRNLEASKQQSIAFCIPLPTHLTGASRLLSRVSKPLSSPEAAFVYQETALYHIQATCTLPPPTTESKEKGTIVCAAHIFYDKLRQATEETNLFRLLQRAEESVNGYRFRSMVAAKETIEEVSPRLSQLFLILRQQDGLFQLVRRKKSIARKLHHFGKYILLDSQVTTEEQEEGEEKEKQSITPTSDEVEAATSPLRPLTKEEILFVYKRKDQIEKCFRLWKNDLDAKRIYAHSRESMLGRLFIIFLSLILYSVLLKRMKDHPPVSYYSVQKMLKKLKTIRLITTKSEKSFLTEISKKQREILDLFGLSL